MTIPFIRGSNRNPNHRASKPPIYDELMLQPPSRPPCFWSEVNLLCPTLEICFIFSDLPGVSIGWRTPKEIWLRYAGQRESGELHTNDCILYMSIKVLVPDSLQNTNWFRKNRLWESHYPQFTSEQKWFPGLFFYLDEPWAKESYHR